MQKYWNVYVQIILCQIKICIFFFFLMMNICLAKQGKYATIFLHLPEVLTLTLVSG